MARGPLDGTPLAHWLPSFGSDWCARMKLMIPTRSGDTLGHVSIIPSSPSLFPAPGLVVQFVKWGDERIKGTNPFRVPSPRTLAIIHHARQTHRTSVVMCAIDNPSRRF